VKTADTVKTVKTDSKTLLFRVF